MKNDREAWMIDYTSRNSRIRFTLAVIGLIPLLAFGAACLAGIA